MALPGLLVEYLITGTLTLAWLAPIVTSESSSGVAHLATLDRSVQLLFLVPSAYAVGMFVDVLASQILRPLKQGIRRYAKRTRGRSDLVLKRGEGTTRKALLAVKAPAAAKEAEQRSSRDRIARGLVLNIVPLLVLALGVPWWVGLLGLVGAAGCWVLFEYSSYTYELDAVACLPETGSGSRNTAPEA